MYSATKEVDQKVATKIPEPTGYKLLIKPLEVKEKTDAGIYMPDSLKSAEQTASVIGFVVKAGPDAYQDKGKFPNGAYCQEGDFVIFQQAPCGGPTMLTQLPSASFSGKLVVSAQRTVTTSTLFATAGELHVCFAAKESLGDQPSDYSQLASTFRLTAMRSTLDRVVHGSGDCRVHVSMDIDKLTCIY